MSVHVTNTDAATDGKTLMLSETNQTVEGLKTFDRGSSPPFAVVAGAAKVANLDADLLDGFEAADFAQTTDLSTLNASNLTSGTVPDARFPATLPAASGVNLTALNASNVASGTLAAARLPPWLNETPITIADGATPALDASLGKTYVLVAAGDRTIAVPSNPQVDGQPIIIRHNASGGARTLALNTGAGGFRFGTDVTGLTQTTSGKTDYIGCKWNATDSKWDVVAYAKGY